MASDGDICIIVALDGEGGVEKIVKRGSWKKCLRLVNHRVVSRIDGSAFHGTNARFEDTDEASSIYQADSNPCDLSHRRKPPTRIKAVRFYDVDTICSDDGTQLSVARDPRRCGVATTSSEHVAGGSSPSLSNAHLGRCTPGIVSYFAGSKHDARRVGQSPRVRGLKTLTM